MRILLSFLSKNFVSIKRRISKGFLTRARLLRQGISRGYEECELFFQQSLQKDLLSSLKIAKKIGKENLFHSGFLRKAIVLKSIYTKSLSKNTVSRLL
jgi:hypothetical protein